MAEELLTTKQVAQYVNLSPKWGFATVLKWVHEGRLRALKAGDTYRFRKEDINEFLSTWGGRK